MSYRLNCFKFLVYYCICIINVQGACSQFNIHVVVLRKLNIFNCNASAKTYEHTKQERTKSASLRHYSHFQSYCEYQLCKSVGRVKQLWEVNYNHCIHT